MQAARPGPANPSDRTLDAVRAIRKDYGIFFTPEWVVDLMVGMVREPAMGDVLPAVLEPACGGAQFLRGIGRRRPALYAAARKVAGGAGAL